MPKADMDKLKAAAWLNISDAAIYSGLSRSLLYELIRDESLTTSTVLRPGCRRGRRLIERASIDKCIEEGIGKASADNTKGRRKRLN
jgi:hypothetical protein